MANDSLSFYIDYMACSNFWCTGKYSSSTRDYSHIFLNNLSHCCLVNTSLKKDLANREKNQGEEHFSVDNNNNNLPFSFPSYFNIIPDTLESGNSFQAYLQRKTEFSTTYIFFREIARVHREKESKLIKYFFGQKAKQKLTGKSWLIEKGLSKNKNVYKCGLEKSWLQSISFVFWVTDSRHFFIRYCPMLICKLFGEDNYLL